MGKREERREKREERRAGQRNEIKEKREERTQLQRDRHVEDEQNNGPSLDQLAAFCRDAIEQQKEVNDTRKGVNVDRGGSQEKDEANVEHDGLDELENLDHDEGGDDLQVQNFLLLEIEAEIRVHG